MRSCFRVLAFCQMVTSVLVLSSQLLYVPSPSHANDNGNPEQNPVNEISAQLQKALGDLKSQIDSLKENIKNLEGDFEGLKSYIGNQTGEGWENLQGDIEEIEGGLSTQKKLIDTVSSNMQLLKSKVTAFTGDTADPLMSDVENLRTEISEVKKATEEALRQEIEAFRDKIVLARATFLMQGFQDIGDRFRTGQLSLIGSTVERYLTEITTGARDRIDIDEAKILNRKWQLEKEELNKRWLQDFFDKEKEYYDAYQRFIEAVQRIKALEIRGETTRGQARQLNRERKYNSRLIAQLSSLKQRLREKLHSRLANIPITLLAIGRFKVETENESKIPAEALNTIITNRMIDKAVRHVFGEVVETYTEIKNDESVKSLIVSQSGGNAMVSDTYYDLAYKFVDDSTRARYQIHRIDVYPFSNGISRYRPYTDPNFEKIGAPYEQKVEIFFVDTITDDPAGLKFTPSEPGGLGSEEHEFIGSQQKIVRETNEKINDEILSLKMDYRKKIDDLESRRDALVDTGKSLDEQLLHLRSAIGSLSEDLAAARNDSIVFKQTQDSTGSVYRNFCRNKVSFANKFEQRWGPQSGNETEHVSEMARQSFRIIEELRGGDREELSIIDISEDQDPIDMKVIKRRVEYKPKIDAFRILYFTIVPTQNNNVSFLLNIAYRLKWSQSLYLDLSREDSVAVWYDPETRLSYECRLTNTRRKNGKVRPTSPYRATSLGAQNRWDTQGWKLPTMEQLKSLRKCIWEEGKPAHNSLVKRFGWPEQGPFLSSESILKHGHRSYLAYELFADDQEGNRTHLQSGDDVHVIRLKEISK